MTRNLLGRSMIAALGGVLLVACGSAEVVAPGASATSSSAVAAAASETGATMAPAATSDGPQRMTDAQLAAFPDFALYSVGDSFDGLPLSETIREKTSYLLRSEDPTSRTELDRLYLIYGQVCMDPLTQPDCYPRVSIEITPACRRNRSMYDGPAAAQPIATRTVRGVPADEFTSSLAIYTGSVAVVIHTNPADSKQADRVAAALEPLNGLAREGTTDSRSGNDLPAPEPGAAEGLAPC